MNGNNTCGKAMKAPTPDKAMHGNTPEKAMNGNNTSGKAKNST